MRNLFSHNLFITWIPASAGMTVLFLTFLNAANPPPNTDLKYKSRDLNKVKAELERKREEKQRLEQETENLSGELKRGEQKLRQTEEALLHTKRKNFELEQNVAQTKISQDQLLIQVEQAKKNVNRSIHNYLLASAVVGPTGPASVYGRQMAHGQAVKLRELRGKREETSEELDALVATQQRMRTEVDRQESVFRNTKMELVGKGKILDKKMTQQEALEADLKELSRTAQELASFIDVLRYKAQADADNVKRARREKELSGKAPISLHSLPWPVQGTVKVNYGRQTHPKLGTPYISNGVTIKTDGTQPVQAVADGRVLYSGKFLSYGTMALIEHAGDWYTVYGLLSQTIVDKGQDVKKGDSVGVTTQKSNSGEAYFEIRFYGKPTDPIPWLVR